MMSNAGPSSREDAARRGYVICCAQRSGSNLLCALLASTGVLGTPLDYFNGPGLRAKGRLDYPQDPAEQLRAILDLQRNENGLYGLKIFSETADRVAYTGWNTRLPNLSYIWLNRQDLLGQAISSVRARQSAQWRSTDAATAPVSYASDQIDAELRRLALGNARWAIFFARHGITPLEIRYEEISEDNQAAVDQVGTLMNVGEKHIIKRDRIELEIQRDTISDQWRDRYLSENSDYRLIDPSKEQKSYVSVFDRISTLIATRLDRAGRRRGH